jgi:hypothetical protein
MNDVKKYQRYGLSLCLLFVMLMAACAPVKTLEVWKAEDYTRQLDKVLVIVLTQDDKIRNQFENVFSDQLAKRGVDAISSHKVLPHLSEKPARDVVVAKVKELGVTSVLVIRSISKKEITNHQYGGVIMGGVAIYSNEGWYSYSYGYGYDRRYDTDFFTISVKLYDVDSKNPEWSYLSQVKVEGSREGAVNLFIPVIVKQLEDSQLVKSLPK